MAENNPEKFIRPDNLLEAIGLGNFKGLTEEERTMEQLLVEDYKKKGQMSLLEGVRTWRKKNPNASLGEAIRGLFQELEKENGQ